MPKKGLLTTKELTRRLSAGTIAGEDLAPYEPRQVIEAKQDMDWAARSIAACVREANEASASVLYDATVEVIDRMDDLILTKPRARLGIPDAEGNLNVGEGWLPENFLAAGAPFLWSHLSREPAVGQVVSSKPKKIETPANGRVWSTQQLVRYLNEERIPYAVPAWILVTEKIARSVSVGFVPILWMWVDDEQLREKLGMRSRWGGVFLTSDQTELSQAQTPANQLALVAKRGLGAWTKQEAARYEKGRAALDRAAEEGREVLGHKVTPALIRDFLRDHPLSGVDEAEMLQTRISSIFDRDPGSEVWSARLIREALDEPEGGGETIETALGLAADPVEVPGEGLGRDSEGSGEVLSPDAVVPMPDGRTLAACAERGDAWAAQLQAEREAHAQTRRQLAESRAQRDHDGPPGAPPALNARDWGRLQRGFEKLSEACEEIGALVDSVDGGARGVDSARRDAHAGEVTLEAVRSLAQTVRELRTFVRSDRGGPRGGDADSPAVAGDLVERGEDAPALIEELLG